MPSLAIGAVAFGASELVFHTTKIKEEMKQKTLQETLQEARQKNEQIKQMAPKIENEELVNDIYKINDSVTKIIDTIEKQPKKFKKMGNFFEYYLPVTINILKKYDEIENQRLTTEDSKKFMESTRNMVKKIEEAFGMQLSNLYQSDMIDMDAEMKVFDTMLKSDGFYGENSDFDIKK
ncbi:MAG: 5-bromo-4-chloroindolyl phosphate hydrolysis family protein [Clostridia bacterium]|nr:5-bromo-4-chloroindolyl phosphate hydrolysis family protein [Clostridia bacterium]